MVTVNVYFNQLIESEAEGGKPAATRSQLVAIAKKLVPSASGFQFEGNPEASFLLFTEKVQIDVSDEDYLAHPLYVLLSEVKPTMEGGEFSCARRVKA